LDRLVQTRKSFEKEFYMPIQDTIGCFAQIKRSKGAIEASLTSKDPVWVLMFESDEEPAEIAHLVTPGWRRFDVLLNLIDELMRQSLLHVLHGSGLDCNDSGCLGRFRDGDDLYRDLRTRLEKLDTCQLVVITPTRESVILVRKYAVQSLRPLTDRKLRVSTEFVSGSPRAVLGDETEPTGWIDDFAIAILFPGRKGSDANAWEESCE
jgi:hypothetical protein